MMNITKMRVCDPQGPGSRMHRKTLTAASLVARVKTTIGKSHPDFEDAEMWVWGGGTS